MTHPPSLSNNTPLGLMALILIQVICAIFFATDVVSDFLEGGVTASSHYHLIIETIATVSLCAAILLETRYFLYLLRRKAHLEKSASVATMAVFDIIESHFDAWQLTPSERDIAMFLVKGLGIAEIAKMRGSAEGTVKSHLNAIYRKSGTANRGELLSSIIDTLIEERPASP